MKTPTPKLRRLSGSIILASLIVACAIATGAVEGVHGELDSETTAAETLGFRHRSAVRESGRGSANITTVAGSGQTAPVNSLFATQLRVLVTEDDVPQPGVTVTFTAPSLGASGTFDGGNSAVEVTTDEDSIATAPPFTANGKAGAYQVLAAIGDDSTTFDLTNTKANQAIDFPALPPRIFGDPPFEVSATASSNLAVSFSITSGPATIDGNTVTITGAGTVTVRALQGGDDQYEPAPPVDRSFTVEKAEQTISFPPLPNITFGTPDFEVTATASSDLEVTLTAIGHCSVTGLTVHLTGEGSCTLTASQNGDSDFSAAANVRQSFFIAAAGKQLFDVRMFGAVGDGVADDSPAFQAALDAIDTAGGGTLVIPEGRYALITPVSKNFAGLASSISIRGLESEAVVNPFAAPDELSQGLDLLSEVFPRTGNANALSISGLNNFSVSDVAFVGTPNVETDAAITLAITDVDDAAIKHCEFYGLRTMVPGAGIVVAQRTGLIMQDTKFLGSFGDSGTYTPNVQNLEWKAINISNVVFIDYGLRPELYCKCQNATYSWINIGNAATVTADSPRREVSIRKVFLDEGAYNGLTSLPSFYQPPSAPIDLIYVSGLRMNVSNFGTSGNYFSHASRVLIADGYYGWSHNADAAITLVGVGNAIIDEAECVADANRIQADATTGSLSVINSTYEQLASQAQVTREIVTDDPEDDPVQYARNRFVETLGREPDPAAHFYWSNLILQCGENTQCVSDQKQALNAYLVGMPSATVALTGQILDENDAAMSNATVALTGSQSATIQTDANGRYSFNGLPSSGVYIITPTLAHYTFSPASRTITTPTTDQTIDFEAIANRYMISGRLVDAQGAAITGVTVNLSGSQQLSASTDLSGSYTFSVPALGSYTVTPTSQNRTFFPTATTVNKLDGPHAADFVGSLLNHNITGRVTVAGVPLPGVAMTLAGTISGTTTTNANGNYSLLAPASGSYTLTPSLVHYTFTPQQLTFNNLSGDQSADLVAALDRHTISGRILNAVNSGVANVTVNLSGTQTATVVTGADGVFNFGGLAGGGNYFITPSGGGYVFVPTSYAFTDLSADQNLQIFGNPPPPQLLIDPSEPAGDVLSAVDSVLLTNGPFQVPQSADWLDLGVRNTRVMLFATDVTLETGENAAAVTIHLIDANNQVFDVAAEDVRPVPNSAIKQIVFRLPDNLALGTCQLKITLHGQSSNSGTFQIFQ